MDRGLRQFFPPLHHLLPTPIIFLKYQSCPRGENLASRMNFGGVKMTSEMNFEGVKMTSKISISEFAKISCGIQFNLSFGMQFPKTCFRKVILEYNYKIEKKELPKMEFRNFFGIPFSEMEKKSAIVPSATPTTTFEKPPQITTVLVSNCQKTAKRKKHQRCFPQRTHLKWR